MTSGTIPATGTGTGPTVGPVPTQETGTGTGPGTTEAPSGKLCLFVCLFVCACVFWIGLSSVLFFERSLFKFLFCFSDHCVFVCGLFFG